MKSIVEGVQHVCLVTSYLIFPAIIISSAGGNQSQALAATSATILMCGIFTYLQSTKWGLGHIATLAPDAFLLPVFVIASALYGIEIIASLTILHGVFIFIASFFVNRLGKLLPLPIIGLVIFVFGLSFASVSLRKITTEASVEVTQNTLFLVTLVLFFIISYIGLQNVYKKIKKYYLLISIILGYVLCGALGLLEFGFIQNLPLMMLPSLQSDFVFTITPFILPVAIITIAYIAGSIGIYVLYGKAKDGNNFTGIDTVSVSNSLRLVAIGTICSGLLGGIPIGLSTANASYCLTQKEAPKKPAITYALIFILLALTPKLCAIIQNVPVPLMSAILLFMGSFMIAEGITTMSKFLISGRQVVTISVALLCAVAIPELAFIKNHPNAIMRSLLTSSVAIATILAVVLDIIYAKILPSKFKRTFALDSSQIIENEDFIKDHCTDFEITTVLYERIRQATGELNEVALGQLNAGSKCELTIKKSEEQIEVIFQGEGNSFTLQQPIEIALDDCEAIPMLGISKKIIEGFTDSYQEDKMNIGRGITLRWNLG